MLAAFLLTSCAGLSDAACRGADWYELGFRDAIFGLQRQDTVYAQQCQSIDPARYAQGWREGRFEADARTPGSVD